MTAWTDAWRGALGPGRSADVAPPDPFTLWQKSVDQWLATMTTQLEQTLQNPDTAGAGGRFLDSLLNVEKPVRERTAATMQLWLEFLNLPTRRDLIRVATQLNDANARLDELQELVETILDRLDELAPERRRRQPAAAGGAA